MHLILITVWIKALSFKTTQNLLPCACVECVNYIYFMFFSSYFSNLPNNKDDRWLKLPIWENHQTAYDLHLSFFTYILEQKIFS